MITAKYKNNVKEYRWFTRYTVMVRNQKMNTALIFGGVAVVLFILAMCLLNSLLLATAALCLLFSAISAGMNLLGVKSATDKQLKNAKDFDRIENTYTFGEEGFGVETVTGKKKEYNEVTYDKIYKVVETKKFFLLYVNTKIAFIIKKDGVEEWRRQTARAVFDGFRQKRYRYGKEKKHGNKKILGR